MRTCASRCRTGARSRAASTAAQPDAIHVATEGPIGLAARAWCRRRGLPFTTSYTTRFPEYIAARFPVPESLSYAVLRRFHGAAAVTMVSTLSLMAELRARGFQNLRMWTRGVDTDLFAPERAVPLDLPRPIFLTAGRVAVEKNLEAFLSLDLPGTKVVVGDGPQEMELRGRFPDVKFLGLRQGTELAGLIAAADVFVFPSRTDTFGVVQLEALACGVPVAAFPVTGPKDVIGDQAIGVLDEDLRGGLPRRAEHFARGVPRLRADALLDDERAAIHRSRRPGRDRQVAPAPSAPVRSRRRSKASDTSDDHPVACMERTQWR